MESPPTLGAKIRNLRLRMNLTQAQLAGKEFTKSFISQIEKGQTRPSLKTLEILARRLNQPISYFLDDTIIRPKPTRAESLKESAAAAAARGDVAMAIQSYFSALEACEPTDFALKGSIWQQLGNLHFRINQMEKAENYLSLACEELERVSPNEYYVRAISDYGSVFYHKKQFQRARELFEKALVVYERIHISNPQLKLTIMSYLATTLAVLQDYSRALEVVEEAIQISKTQGEYWKFGELWHICGYVHDRLGNFELAIEATQRAIAFYGAVENTPLYLSCKVNRAIHLRNLHRLGEAKAAAMEVVREARRARISYEAARAHAELAHIAVAEGEYDQAVENVKRALELSPSHAEIPEWLEILVRVGEARPLPREWVDQLAQHVARWRGDDRARAEAHSSLGSLYRQLGDAEKANHHLSESVALFKKSQA